MALTEKQIGHIREELLSSKRPLFFFDDDPDGLSSFLLLYRLVREGHGIVVKATPELNTQFLNKVEEYSPDKIFVLDKPSISQDFIDQAKVPIIWIDHHEPVIREHVQYFNPRVTTRSDNKPTSYWCYKVAKQDLWIAMVGIVGDWYMPLFAKAFREQYPDLLPAAAKRPEQALYTTELGKLVRIFSFVLKGRTSDTNSCIRVLTRIETPYEIMREESGQGRFIYRKYAGILSIYNELLADASVEGKKKDSLLVYNYSNQKMSFTGDLSNELIFRFPKKVIIVARQKGDEMKCSLRSARVKILPVIKRALVGIEGYGGGHELACGACVKVLQWEQFLDQFRMELEKEKPQRRKKMEADSKPTQSDIGKHDLHETSK